MATQENWAKPDSVGRSRSNEPGRGRRQIREPVSTGLEGELRAVIGAETHLPHMTGHWGYGRHWRVTETGDRSFARKMFVILYNIAMSPWTRHCSEKETGGSVCYTGDTEVPFLMHDFSVMRNEYKQYRGSLKYSLERVTTVSLPKLASVKVLALILLGQSSQKLKNTILYKYQENKSINFYKKYQTTFLQEKNKGNLRLLKKLKGKINHCKSQILWGSSLGTSRSNPAYWEQPTLECGDGFTVYAFVKTYQIVCFKCVQLIMSANLKRKKKRKEGRKRNYPGYRYMKTNAHLYFRSNTSFQ